MREKRKCPNCSKETLSIKQTEEELKELLKEQIQLLVNACQLYDKGCKIEAKNIAIRLRVILWDKGRNTSLLTLLKKKNILFYDSAHDEGLLAPFMSIIGIRTSSDGIEYIPNLDKIPELISNNWINFEEWWDNAIIKGPFTRGDLILAVSHKVGGAHVDLKLDKKYSDLTRNNAMGFTHHNHKGVKTIPQGIELVVLRQIAYETLKTLNNEFPEIFTNLKMLL